MSARPHTRSHTGSCGAIWVAEIVLFGEDYAHQAVVGALVGRLSGVPASRLVWRSAARGHGRVVAGLAAYSREVEGGEVPRPDVVVVATDANCKGFAERAKAFSPGESRLPLVLAIPDPHVERWLLLDGGAFRAVFGRGCDAPDRKCDRDRYKWLLAEAVHAAGGDPELGGLDFAGRIVQRMDLRRAARADRSFGRFVADMRAALVGLGWVAGD